MKLIRTIILFAGFLMTLPLNLLFIIGLMIYECVDVIRNHGTISDFKEDVRSFWDGCKIGNRMNKSWIRTGKCDYTQLDELSQ